MPCIPTSSLCLARSIRVNQAHSSGKKDGRVGWEKVPMGAQESSRARKRQGWGINRSLWKPGSQQLMCSFSEMGMGSGVTLTQMILELSS